jgi:hypothetical protein
MDAIADLSTGEAISILQGVLRPLHVDARR